MVVRRLLLVSLLTASFVAGGSDGVIEGKVVSLTTGLPLNKAEVTLSYGKTASGAVTDSAGKFVFDELDPGEYYLSADHFGYLDNSDERTPLIRLAAGQHRKDIVLTLTPQGILAGRVLDEDGDPVPKAQISFQRYAALGVKKPAESESFEVDGEAAFKFTGLRPGRYYLSAIPKDPYERTDGDEGFVTTYYPNAIREEAATAIVLAPGAEMRNIEIRLRKARLFRVRGKVNGLGPGSGYSLILMADRHIAYDAQIKPDGTFTFDSVLPGSYTIKTGVSRYERRGDDFIRAVQTAFCNYPVSVGSQNVDDLVIAASPVEDLAGRIKMDPPIPEKRPVVVLTPETVPWNGKPPQTEVADDGTFRLSSLPPDEYRVQLQTLPEGMYLKSIRYEGQEVANAKIDLNRADRGPLEVVLAPNAAEVMGVLAGSDGKPVDDATVVIWRDDSTQRSQTGDDGTFSFHNLAPGDYFVAAIDEYTGMSLSMDSDIRARVAEKATKVTLTEGSKQQVEVKFIDKATIEALLSH